MHVQFTSMSMQTPTVNLYQQRTPALYPVGLQQWTQTGDRSKIRGRFMTGFAYNGAKNSSVSKALGKNTYWTSYSLHLNGITGSKVELVLLWMLHLAEGLAHMQSWIKAIHCCSTEKQWLFFPEENNQCKIKTSKKFSDVSEIKVLNYSSNFKTSENSW